MEKDNKILERINMGKVVNKALSQQITPDSFVEYVDANKELLKRMNEEAKTTAMTRPKIIRCIQNFMDNRGFVEVETPIETANSSANITLDLKATPKDLILVIYLKTIPLLFYNLQSTLWTFQQNKCTFLQYYNS